MQLQRRGHPFEKVRKRHRAYAQELVNEDIYFQSRIDGGETNNLIRRRLPSMDTFTVAETDGVIGSLSKEEELLGVLVVALAEFDGSSVAFIRGLAVEEGHQGRGIGTVLLGLIDQMTDKDAGGRKLAGVVGSCAVDEDAFYQKAGYTVLQPGQPMPWLYGAQAGTRLENSNPTHDCWFYREYF